MKETQCIMNDLTQNISNISAHVNHKMYGSEKTHCGISEAGEFLEVL